MPPREIVSNFVESVVVGDYSFKLKFGKILFEEHSKARVSLTSLCLMSLLRDKSSSVSMKECHFANLKQMVDGWITYDLNKTGSDIS